MRALILGFMIAVGGPAACHGQCRSCLPATLFSWSGDRQPLGELGPITTDRPDFTEASSTVGLGVSQLEAGYTFVSSDELRVHSWGEPLLRYGVLANWFELRLAVAPLSTSGSQSTSGVEDLYLGAKIWLTQQQGFLPEVAIVPQMRIPTGSSAFTADRVLPGANLLYGWDVTENMTFAGSTQYNRAVDDFLAPHDLWAQSLTVGMSLTDQLGSYFEWFAFFPSGADQQSDAHFLNGGLTYQLTDDLQFDVRAGKGLSDTSDEYFVGLGVSIRCKGKR